MLLLDVCLSYGGFQPDHMINCRSLAPEATLGVGKKVVGKKLTKLAFCCSSYMSSSF